MSTSTALQVEIAPRIARGRLSGERPEKVHDRHLDRLAVVYIRQSSMTQVLRNQESTRLQYSLTGVAKQLGWPDDRILVIDDDLGVSGASAIGREGFQRLLAEVALDHVGMIVGAEMSRLARSNKDWHQLLELCARFGTLIADLDGLYDPALYNDRLLLGLKGTMSEAELHILRQRLLQGKLQKARRGELGMPVPTGYLRKPSGEVVLDPDEEAQAVVRLVFDTFERVGTTHGVLRELAKNEVQIGVRLRTGPDIGKLVWYRPHRGMIANMLRNPIFAGAYVYGRRQIDPRRQKPGRPASGRTSLLAPEEWLVCLHDRLPAYVTWQQYERNQERLRQNRASSQTRGPVRDGSALLHGLVVCGRCGYRMAVQYASRSGKTYGRYTCNHAAAARGEPVCSGLSARAIDDAVTKLALAALEPSALEVSTRVAEQIDRERHKADDLWRKRLERARYEAERAERQYQVVEPENRLVARTLEATWEQKLQAERELQEQHRRHRAQQPRQITEAERKSILALAHDVPELWKARTTKSSDRKAILRLLVNRVVVSIDGDSECVELVVQWAGGHETRQKLLRPLGRLEQLSSYKALLAEIHELRGAGNTAGQIAEKLNAAGHVTATQRNSFNERLVRMILNRHGSVPKGPRARPTDDPNEWPFAELARELDMAVPTIYGWFRRGWISARRVRGKWVARVDAKDLEQLRVRRAARAKYGARSNGRATRGAS
jgi:DNA invertase Pin-like site-specific DNA recombinase